jgi:hypothetical protein
MDERTTINVKSVDLTAWNLARRHAAQRGLAMGEWLSNAIRTQAAIEAGDAVLPPGGPSLEALQAALAALAPVLPSVGELPSARLLADTYARKVLGLPAPSTRRWLGKTRPEIGQSLGNPGLLELEHEKIAAPDVPETAAEGHAA